MDTQAAKALLGRITHCGFALVDLNLYLDTHPADTRALDEYINVSEQLGVLKNEYIKGHAPLGNFGGANNSGWLWNDAPWPWDTKGESIKDVDI